MLTIIKTGLILKPKITKKLMPTKKPGARKKNPAAKSLVSKNRFSKRAMGLFIAIFAAVGGYVLWLSFAAPNPPTVYLQTGSGFVDSGGGFVKPGSTFTVQVYENSGTTGVNSVDAEISYPTSLLTYVSTDFTGTQFQTTPLIAPSATGGVLSIVNNVSCSDTTTPPSCHAPLTGTVLVATVTFRAASISGSSSAAAMTFTTFTGLGSTTGANLITNIGTMTGPLTVNIDGSAPTVSVTAPANNSTQKFGGTVTITANPADNDKVASLDIYVDSSKVTTLSASPWSYSWNTSTYSLGSHSLKAVATDPSGNSTTSSVVTVNVTDQTAPSTPTNFRVTGTGQTTVNLAWSSSTDDVGVTGYKLTRNGTVIASNISSSQLSYSDSGLSASTTYSYALVALDAAGNASAAANASATTSSFTVGDINKDGIVNGADLAFLAANYKTTTAAADLNGDHIVDISDLALLLSHYGQ